MTQSPSSLPLALDERGLEQKRCERENVAFHKWWKESGHAADKVNFSLTTENACHAAWQARAALSAVPASQAVAWRRYEADDNETASFAFYDHPVDAGEPLYASPLIAQEPAEGAAPDYAALLRVTPEGLCEDCPPEGYPTDKTRCLPCPRRAAAPSPQGREGQS